MAVDRDGRGKARVCRNQGEHHPCSAVRAPAIVAKRWRDDQNQGTNTLLWGNDYPHGDSVFPHSQRILSEILRDCTPEERYEMTVKNVVELYNLPFTLNGPSQVKVAAGIGRS